VVNEYNHFPRYTAISSAVRWGVFFGPACRRQPYRAVFAIAGLVLVSPHCTSTRSHLPSRRLACSDTNATKRLSPTCRCRSWMRRRCLRPRRQSEKSSAFDFLAKHLLEELADAVKAALRWHDMTQNQAHVREARDRPPGGTRDKPI